MFVNTTQTAMALMIPGVESALLGPVAQAGGALNVIHQVVPDGAATPAHRHDGEDQISIVLEGRIGFWVEREAEVELGGDSFIFRPRGRLHALWNDSGAPARMLEITTPAESFERWMRQLSELTRAGGSSEAQVRELAAGFGITFAGPDDPDPTRDRHPGQRDVFWAEGGVR